MKSAYQFLKKFDPILYTLVRNTTYKWIEFNFKHLDYENKYFFCNEGSTPRVREKRVRRILLTLFKAAYQVEQTILTFYVTGVDRHDEDVYEKVFQYFLHTKELVETRIDVDSDLEASPPPNVVIET
jgi:hypothetical protein